MKVEYMTHSGNDLLVVNAARASFGKESDWEYEQGTTVDGCTYTVYHLSDRDKKLIDYLAREKHILPFRHPQVTLRCKAPIFLARQLGKHQVGMSWSEESRRYITTPPEFFWPDKFRLKADNIKQGSGENVPDEVEQTCTEQIKNAICVAVDTYHELLGLNVAPELARMILPQNMFVTWVWTGSLLSFYQLYKLRAEAHAQKEARDFAEMIKAEVSKLYPESWAALERHV